MVALTAVAVAAAAGSTAGAAEIPIHHAELFSAFERARAPALTDRASVPCVELQAATSGERPEGPDGWSMKLDAQVSDAKRTEHGRAQRWLAENPFAPYRNTVTTSVLTAKGLDDRVRLSSGLAFSQFREDAVQPFYPDAETWIDPDTPDGEHGAALWQSFDVELLRGDTRASAFFKASSAGSRFDGHDLAKRDRPFAKPGEERVEYGGKVGWRPLDFTVRSKQRLRAASGSRSHQRSVETVASLSTAELIRLAAPSSPQTGSMKLLPTHAWASYESGDIDAAGYSATSDAFETLGFGVTWSLGSFYTTCGYWTYTYDGRQSWAPDADWVGDGVYVSAGYAVQRWRADVYGGMDTGDDHGRNTRSAASNLDGGLLLSFTPSGRLPDIELDLTTGLYATDYLAYDYEADTTLFQFSAELDFAKFVPALRDRAGSRLSAFYGARSVEYADDLAGSSTDAEHVVGLRVTRPLP